MYFYPGDVAHVAQQTSVIDSYGLCWICKGASKRPIVAFDRAMRAITGIGGYANLCAHCIPIAKTLAGLQGWRKP